MASEQKEKKKKRLTTATAVMNGLFLAYIIAISESLSLEERCTNIYAYLESLWMPSLENEDTPGWISLL